jgi:hypothetical protein
MQRPARPRDRMTRVEQVKTVLQVLRETHNPTPKRDDPTAKRNVEAAVDQVAEQRAEYEEYDIKRKLVIAGQRRIVAALRRQRGAYPREAAPTLDPLIDRLIAEASREQVWTEGEDHITILSGLNPKDTAAEFAVRLFRIHGAPSKRKGREAILPPTTRGGVVCKLAAILYGDRKADLFQYVRKIVKKHRHEIRYLLARKNPLTDI